jgi:hypothetical protein
MKTDEGGERLFPGYARETTPVARRFVQAVKEQNSSVLAPLLMPESEADWAFRLFGLGPLVFMLYLHLECDRFVLPRYGRRSDREVLVEVGWVVGEDDAGKLVYDPRRLSSITMARQEAGWRVADLNPGPLDAPVSVPEAQDLLHRVVREGWADDPTWYPMGVLTGAFQLKRMGREALDEVESLFVHGMEASCFGVPEIIRAVRLWREFRRKADPSYRRPQVYAAAIEYIMVLFGFYTNSQIDIAERYDVSPSTVSGKWHEIEAVLGLSQFDPRYSVHEDPGAGLEALLRRRGERVPPPLPLGAGRQGRAMDKTVP